MCLLVPIESRDLVRHLEKIGVNLNFIEDSISRDLLLVPDSDCEDEPRIGDGFSGLTGEGGCTAKLSIVGKADIRGQFAAELIAQTYPCVDIGESRSDSARRVLFAVKVHLELWLCDETLRKPQIIGARQPRREVTSVTEVERRFKLEKVVASPSMPTAPQTRFGPESISVRIPA
jgi:hypothetical protein